MIEPTHSPNRIELMMAFAVIGISLIATGIIFPMLISTDKLPLTAIILIFCTLLLLMILIMQEIFNFFYNKWQRKNKPLTDRKENCEKR